MDGLREDFLKGKLQSAKQLPFYGLERIPFLDNYATFSPSSIVEVAVHSPSKR